MELEKGIEHLKCDDILTSVIERVGPIEWEYNEDVYSYLIRAITSQQLSTKVAEVIHGRLLNLFKDKYPHAHLLRDYPHDQLRGIGLSNSKANYVRNVATYFVENDLLQAQWHQFSDDEIIENLTQIKGVGKWTVQMILIAALRRMDVFPVDDLGIQQGIKGLYELDSEGKYLKAEITEIAEQWKPYRTIASIYIWRNKDSQ
jgi:DNA-3-methyladenine glycosylase II